MGSKRLTEHPQHEFKPQISPAKYIILSRLEVAGPLPGLAFHWHEDPLGYADVEEILNQMVDEKLIVKFRGRYKILDKGRGYVMPRLVHGGEKHQEMITRAARFFQYYPPYHHFKPDTGRRKWGGTHHSDGIVTPPSGSSWNLENQFSYEAEVNPTDEPALVAKNYQGNLDANRPSIFQPYDHRDRNRLVRILENQGAKVTVGLTGFDPHNLDDPERVWILAGLVNADDFSVEDENLERVIRAKRRGKSLTVNKKKSGSYIVAYDPNTQKSKAIHGRAGQTAIDLAEGQIELEEARKILEERKSLDKYRYAYYAMEKRIEFFRRIDASLAIQEKLRELAEGPYEEIPLSNGPWEPEDLREKVAWYAVSPIWSPFKKCITNQISMDEALEMVRKGFNLKEL